MVSCRNHLVNNLISVLFLLSFVIYFTKKFSSADNVNPYLKRFSKINFNSHDLIKRHDRIRRSLDDHIRLKFHAHEKTFDLKLTPVKTSNFENDYIEINDQKLPLTDFKIYEGYLLDEPKTSKVSGSIIDGSFIGQIYSQNDGNYFIEPAERYENINDANAIIYHENDVHTNEHVNKMRHERSANTNDVNENNLDGDIGCGSTNKHVRDKLAEEQSKITNESRKKRAVKEEKVNIPDNEPGTYKYSQEANKRIKRQSSEFVGGRTVCNMYLKIDPYLYDTIFNKEGKKSEVLTTNYLTYYLNQQISSLNSIYKTISSSDSSYFQTLSFKIYKMKIYKLSDCSNTSSSWTNEEKKLCDNYLDAVTFLGYVSLDNYTDYCLSYTFTSRDFTDGTLGLAWLGSSTGAVGGICEKPIPIQGVTKSLNSGIVTLVNFNSRVPEVVNQITFAHEVGHSLGAQHDPSTSTCSPGGISGNYIMYSRATTGRSANNRRFSSCSISFMNTVLKSLLSSSKNCLRLPNEAICGNGIIESGETCDTGSSRGGTCCINCRISGACDPSQGPCCNPTTCDFYRDNRTCLANDDCREDIRCSGVSAACPITNSTFFKPDLTLCNNGTQVCKSGVCTDSICDKFNMTQCYIEGNLTDPNTDKTTLCYLACNGSSTNFQCKFTADIGEFQKQTYSLRPGSPCSGTLGYCDVFSKCRSVNSQGVLAKLLTVFDPSKTIQDLKTFAIDYWWAILIFCIIFLILNGLLLFCVIRNIGTDNPEKKMKDLNGRKAKSTPKVQSSMPAPRSGQRRGDSVMPTPREVQPSIFYQDRSTDSSQISLRTVDPRTLKKIKRAQNNY